MGAQAAAQRAALAAALAGKRWLHQALGVPNMPSVTRADIPLRRTASRTVLAAQLGHREAVELDRALQVEL